MQKKEIYLDYAATTYIDPKVLAKMSPYLKSKFGNASSFYSLGQISRNAIESSRQTTAAVLNCSPSEIIFTGSGTESDNLAMFGIARQHKKLGNHIIVSKIEHKAVLEPAKQLEKEGFKITYLNVDKNGIIKLDELKKALTPKTILVSIMYANNEIGTIQPISEISKIIKIHNSQSGIHTIFHTDACQAAGALMLDVKKLGVDALTLNGSKIYGPKGIGCLYLKENLEIQPMIWGGGQEKGLRAGTENPALIVGFSEAFKLADKSRQKESRRLAKLRDYAIKNILKTIRGVRLNGHPQKRLSNNINLSFDAVEGEALVLHLDRFGIYASSGSACASNDFVPSHVLSALKIPGKIIHNNLRITMGRKTSKSDTDYLLKVLPEIVENLRQISSVR